MQLNPQQCIAQLSAGKLPPVLLLFGDEAQQKLDVTDALRKAAYAQGFSERHQFTADSDFDWNMLASTANTLSLFADKQLIELHLPSAKPGTQGSQALIEFTQTAPDDVILFIHGPQVNPSIKNSKWFKSLHALGPLCQCYELKGKALINYLQHYAQTLHLKIDNDAIVLLTDMNEGNLLAAKQEIDKLQLSIKDASQPISAEAIAKVLTQQSRYSIYELTDLILAADMQKVAKILLRLEQEGTEPNIIVWQLINECQKLMACQQQLRDTGSINYAQLRIWQNKQSLYQQALSRLDQQALLNLQSKLAQADLLFKSEQVEKPFILLAHLSMLFMPVDLSNYEMTA